MKTSEGKYEPTLVYTSLIKFVAKVRRFGINKHDNSEDWRTTEPIKHFDAAIRHINEHLDGHPIDEQSGEPVLAHAVCNLMFEIERLYGDSTVQHIIRYKVDNQPKINQ